MLPVGMDLTYHQDQTQKAGKRHNYKIQIYHSIIFAAGKIIEKAPLEYCREEPQMQIFLFFMKI